MLRNRHPPKSNAGTSSVQKEDRGSTVDEIRPLLQHAAKLDLAELDPTVAGHVTWITTKWSILRLTGCVYFIAFLGAYYQNPGLIGSHGLQPATDFFTARLQPSYPTDPWNGFLHHPTIFWYTDLNDENLMKVYTSGLTLSALVISGVDSMVIMAALWLLYFSVVTVAGGTAFYSYGWESQLLETGFLCIFLCDFFPRFGLGRRPYKSPPSPIVLWLFRWLCFRISIGAGLIKIRGDSCWTKKTCLYYHFETQPIPSPLSFLFHFLPKWALTHAVDLDLFVQVYTSWMVLLPTHVPGSPKLSRVFLWIVRIGGFVQAGFMVNIILSGNFSFLNHLTIIPALACLDDACWPQWMRTWTRSQVRRLHFQWGRNVHLLLDLALLGLIGSLSQPVVENLLQLRGRHQQMNASFGSFRLVNTYGAFGSVGKERYEPIVSISYDGQNWLELEFPCKPGTVTRRPCFCAPYHYRVDWNIWFIGFKPHDRMLHDRETWMFALLSKLLNQSLTNRPWLELLDSSSANILRQNYDNYHMVPLYAKVDMYHYKMAAPLWQLLMDFLAGRKLVWWKREFEEVLIPPVQRDVERQRLVVVDL